MEFVCEAGKFFHSLRCSPTCQEIPGIVRLRNGSQKLVLTPRMDARICVSISDWLVSHAPCDWSYFCEIYHAMLKISIVALRFKRLKRLCLIRLFRTVFMLSRQRKEKRKIVTLKGMETIRLIHWDWKFGIIFAIDRIKTVQTWGWIAYTTSTVCDACTFAVLCWVTCPFRQFTRVYKGNFMLCYKEEFKVEQSR